jgi:fatty acid desaturase
MAKDRQARRDNRITVMAIANMLASLVDAMRQAEVGHDVIHRFLDSFERMNALTLTGPAWGILSEFVDIVRTTVPSND